MLSVFGLIVMVGAGGWLAHDTRVSSHLINETRTDIAGRAFSFATAVSSRSLGLNMSGRSDSTLLRALKYVDRGRLVDFGVYDQKALVLKECREARSPPELYYFPNMTRFQAPHPHKEYGLKYSKSKARRLSQCILRSRTCRSRSDATLACASKRIRYASVSDAISKCFWENVTVVNLSNNSIGTLSVHSTFFSRYHLISMLDLTGNPIKVIRPALFSQTLKMLRILLLSSPLSPAVLRPNPLEQAGAGAGARDEHQLNETMVAAVLATDTHLKYILIGNGTFEVALRRDCSLESQHYYRIQIIDYERELVTEGLVEWQRLQQRLKLLSGSAVEPQLEAEAGGDEPEESDAHYVEPEDGHSHADMWSVLQRTNKSRLIKRLSDASRPGESMLVAATSDTSRTMASEAVGQSLSALGPAGSTLVPATLVPGQTMASHPATTTSPANSPTIASSSLDDPLLVLDQWPENRTGRHDADHDKHDEKKSDESVTNRYFWPTIAVILAVYYFVFKLLC